MVVDDDLCALSYTWHIGIVNGMMLVYKVDVVLVVVMIYEVDVKCWWCCMIYKVDAKCWWC